jgi:5-formyltetrahydrofolate cyclo-ligase
MRARRRALSLREREQCARSAARHLSRSPLFRRSRRIACYLAQDGEMDPAPLMASAWAMGKTLYLPALHAMPAGSLWFAPYRPGAPLRYNRFDIPEPDVPLRQMVRAQDLDLVLAPLVAFDAAGNRLGMGKAFYDRSLAFLQQRRHWLRPRVVGFAYGFQEVAQLNPHPWDIPLHAVATESGLRELRG